MKILRFLLLCLALVISTSLVGAQTVDPFQTRVVAWSPDGTRIAVGLAFSDCEYVEGTEVVAVQILDSITQSVLQNLQSLKCSVTGIAWSSDGQRLAASSLNAFGIRVWNTQTGELISEAQMSLQGYTSIDWTQGNTHLISATMTNDVVLVDPVTGDIVDVSSSGGIVIARKPDLNTIASGGNIVAEIYITDFPGTHVFIEVDSQEPITDLDWDLSGTALAASSLSGNIAVWNSNGQLQRTIFAQVDRINAIDWRPNSNQLASAGQDGTIIIWDTTTGTIVEQYQAAGPVYDLSWRPDGSVLAYADGGDAPKFLSPNPVPTATPTPSPTPTPTPVCTGARDAGGDLCQPAPTATISPTPSPTVTPTPILSTSIYADRYLIASGDFNPAQFDTVFVATSPSSSTATVILGSSSGFSDLRAELAALTCPSGDWEQCLDTAFAPWTLDAFGRCNTRIPHFTVTSVGAGTPTPTPIPGAGYPVAEYPGKTNHDLWQYCVVHVSVLAFIRFVDLFNGTMNSDISYDTLLQTLMWSELGAQNRNICLQGFRYSATGSTPPVSTCDNAPNHPAEPVTWIWTDEVFARILFTNCQNDGCSSPDFELHSYLAYFQPARDGKLDNQYESVNDDQYPLAKNLLDRSTLIVARFPPTSWLVGRIVGRPSGFATDLSVNAQSDVWLTGRSKIYADADYLGRTNGCNLDGVALPLVYAVGDRRDIFFGTIANTSASEVCKFFDFTNDTPPSTYSSRP